MIKINKHTEVNAFNDFKSVVKGTLGMQMFKSTDYYIRQAAGANNLFTVRFSPKVEGMTSNALKRAWIFIYRDCLAYGIGDSRYVEGFIPEPFINNRTLIFTIDFLK